MQDIKNGILESKNIKHFFYKVDVRSKSTSLLYSIASDMIFYLSSNNGPQLKFNPILYQFGIPTFDGSILVAFNKRLFQIIDYKRIQHIMLSLKTIIYKMYSLFEEIECIRYGLINDVDGSKINKKYSKILKNCDKFKEIIDEVNFQDEISALEKFSKKLIEAFIKKLDVFFEKKDNAQSLFDAGSLDQSKVMGLIYSSASAFGILTTMFDEYQNSFQNESSGSGSGIVDYIVHYFHNILFQFYQSFFQDEIVDGKVIKKNLVKIDTIIKFINVIQNNGFIEDGEKILDALKSSGHVVIENYEIVSRESTCSIDVFKQIIKPLVLDNFVTNILKGLLHENHRIDIEFFNTELNKYDLHILSLLFNYTFVLCCDSKVSIIYPSKSFMNPQYSMVLNCDSAGHYSRLVGYTLCVQDSMINMLANSIEFKQISSVLDRLISGVSIDVTSFRVGDTQSNLSDSFNMPISGAEMNENWFKKELSTINLWNENIYLVLADIHRLRKNVSLVYYKSNPSAAAISNIKLEPISSRRIEDDTETVLNRRRGLAPLSDGTIRLIPKPPSPSQKRTHKNYVHPGRRITSKKKSPDNDSQGSSPLSSGGSVRRRKKMAKSRRNNEPNNFYFTPLHF